MNYQMGDFGFLDWNKLMDQGSKLLNDPKTQQQLLTGAVNLIKPKPPKPKPVVVSGGTVSSGGGTTIVNPPKDNTMLIIGASVAGVAVLAIIAGIVMARRK